uniref:E3 ubiquitin-protein ligase n=1 Tax=Chenopodium quinoa TaxID=63459 RepID=A0A803MGT7_CHEQI
MDIGSPSSTLSPRHRIIQGLSMIGVPEEYLRDLQPGLVCFIKNNKPLLSEIVSAIIPTDLGTAGNAGVVCERKFGSKKALDHLNLKDLYRESMCWLKWLMFEREPNIALNNLASLNVGQRGVCGVIWRENDLAFRCNTCGHDPACAICLPCFQKGNHENHDFFTTTPGAGCCDCGDESAWKREGFCSEHKGAEQIQPLPDEIACSVEPVLDLLLKFWKDNMLRRESTNKHGTELRKVVNELSYSVVEMLLDFCNHSESLLSFVSKRLIHTVDLLKLLVRSERFLSPDVTKKLHELLLKLLCEPIFKHDFAEVFTAYYPVTVSELLKTSSYDFHNSLVMKFSVHIFTVPTLAPHLFSMWPGVHNLCIRVMTDINHVLSHSDLLKYVTHERFDTVKDWLQIMSLVQGMNPQQRERTNFREDVNAELPFNMCSYIAKIHFLLVKGSFSGSDHGSEEMDEASSERVKKDTDDGYSKKLAEVGRLSGEASSQKLDANQDFEVLPSVLQLAFETTKAIDCWLAESNLVSHVTSDISYCISAFKEASFNVKKGVYTSGSSDVSSGSTLQTLTHDCPVNTGDVDKDVNFLESETSVDKDALSLLSLSVWPDIDYDISSQGISLHMPFHGLLSLILKQALRHYYGDFVLTNKDDFTYLNPLSDHLDFFQKVLRGCHPYGFSSFMMEHPLQSRVFCSQVRAGMSNQESELDLFLLQLCAAFAPADLYVTRILERFQLSNYLALDLKHVSEYESVLMQEMLTLIIQIVKERQLCGLTTSQSLQRELICKLAAGDATHSELVKGLPKELCKLDLLQEGKYSLRMPYWKELDLYHPYWKPRDLQVAEERYSRFCGVSALSTQLPKWTNVYHPLIGIARVATCKTTLQVIRAVLYYAVFTDRSAKSSVVKENRSAESRAPDGVLITALHLLSLALDICSLQKKSGHISTHDGDCFPLLFVATEEIEVGLHDESGCPSLLLLLVMLMRMHRKDNMVSSTEAGNFNISSFVEILLKKFAELDSKCMVKLQQFAPEIVNYRTDDIVDLSSASDTKKRKMKARERQAAILAKMKVEQSKFLANLTGSADTESDHSGFGNVKHASNVLQETQVCCLCHDSNSANPVSFLILLQKSRIVNFVDRGYSAWDQGWHSDGLESSVKACMEKDPLASSGSNAISVESLPSSELLPLVEGAIDEFAAQAHPEELNNFVVFCKSKFPELQKTKNPGKLAEMRNKTACSLESLEQDLFLSIYKEISCNDNSGFTSDGERISTAEDTTKSSNQVSLLLGKYIAALTKQYKDTSQNNNIFPSYDGFGPLNCDGIHISSCGHAVHQGCLDRYLSSNERLISRRMVSEGRLIDDLDQGKFLCPVCRRLADSTLPVVPDDSHNVWEQPTNFNIPSMHSLGSLTASKQECGSLRLQYALSMLQTAASTVSRSDMLKALPMQRNTSISPNLEPVFQLLTGMSFPGKQDVFLRSGRASPSVLMWATLKHSLVSTEIASRCEKSSLSARKGLSSLDDEYRSSCGFILPMLLKVIQSTRSTHLPDLLVRFRGLQLFSASICSGINNDKCPEGAISGEGKFLWILKHANGEMAYPDMQFWDQASHPVLIHDPFSTLMWVLFCLPSPFLSTQDSFLSLVHVFYGVSIIQAVFTYCSYAHRNVNDLGFHDCLIADIAKLAEKSVITKQIFISNHVDPSCHVKDVIDNLTLPYLRRCLLLQKLLKCSEISPSPSWVDDFDKSIGTSDCQEDAGMLGNRDETKELRNIFRIPPLDIVLKDGGLRSMMFKWFHHFSKDFEDQCVHRTLYSTPAVPFQLIRLPAVYQDLVQRYIKVPCPICETVQNEPALCLLCGRLCSPAWNSCCSGSECQAHAMSCGAGTGVFLLIRKTTILLQRNVRKALWPSPYLDAYGEEDAKMRRGKPLYLNEERYAALTYMVASHGLDQSSEVLRQTTIGPYSLV